MPVVGPTQILVRVEAAGVAFNDVMTRRGRNPGRVPRVLGFDVVGQVPELGAAVTSVHVGQRVAALIGIGGYSAFVAIEAQDAVAVRPDLDPAEVDALVLNYVTAWQLLYRVAQVRPGQTILVLGAAGGVGSALLELAKIDGITVYGTASPSRSSVVVAAGGHWIAATADVPVKVDAVFDSVGGPSLRASRLATRPGGVVVSFGFSFAATAGYTKSVGLARTAAALVRAKLTPGPAVRLYRIDKQARTDSGAYRADLNQLMELLAAGVIHPAVSRLPLTEAAEAHRRLEAREVVGKLVLMPGNAS